MMRAAVVREFGRPPQYGQFDEPSPDPSETVVSVRAAAVTPLARSRASGAHYSSGTPPPFVAGADGVGVTDAGERVYFSFPRAPFGSMAERAPAARAGLIAVPEGLDSVTAAAAANPGMSCWAQLTRLAPIRPGESVLVNGATGVAGRIAVQVARHLGAAEVIATGRNEAELKAVAQLGARQVVTLGPAVEQVGEQIRTLAAECRIGVVLDYLWGPSAAAILGALGGPNAPRGPTRIRYVQVGDAAGPTINLAAAPLRSSGVEILGGGIGSLPEAERTAGIREFLNAFRPGGFRIETEVFPLSEVEQAWGRRSTGTRTVLTQT
jgi:NADPH:quinone reductase-like Zn-dependent oxidoreductase